MKTLKVVGYLIGIFALLVVAGGLYLKFALPHSNPSPDLKVERTAKRINNGRYLANNVTLCMDCHSTRDWSLYAGPMTADGVGAGGEVFNQEMGFPGTFYASNITPAGIGSWTDGDVFRAVTTGVSKDGRALFPVMGYARFGKMDKEDIYDIIAYIRTLNPVKKDIPQSKIDFPVNFIINTMPQKASFGKKPNPKDSVRYGGYLINAAGCVECHSKTDKGNVIAGTEFGGGMEFSQPAGLLTSPNITFDSATGIGSWTKEQFLKRFQSYQTQNISPARVAATEMNTPMPWTMYNGMKKSDLESIYSYLKQFKPIKNKVVRFTPSNKIAAIK
jgi:mono/diheme cytochrome c family protein